MVTTLAHTVPQPTEFDSLNTKFLVLIAIMSVQVFRTHFEKQCGASTSVTRKNRQSCPKTISLEKLKILAPTQKLPKTVGDLGKLIAAKGLKKLPKIQ